MFLWARLVLEYLSSNMFAHKTEVMDAVDALPRELSELFVTYLRDLTINSANTFSYGQILARLMSNFDKRSIARMKSILGWIAFAKRPLRKAEFRSALSFDEQADDLNVQDLAPDYFFDMCAPLIEKRMDSTFCFIHVSVKE